MINRRLAAFTAACLLGAQCLPLPAHADNQMGYRLLSPQEAAQLPRNHGSLGLNIERAERINDGGMSFDLIRVTQVRRGSPGARAGFSRGDEIIAVDGRVFPSLATFAAYVGATPPGSQLTVDYIPAGGGPQQAQRVAVAIGAGQAAMSNRPMEAPAPSGMSTGTKVAIGAGAVALLGCYEMGCFSRRSGTPTPNTGQQRFQQPGGLQQGQMQ